MALSWCLPVLSGNQPARCKQQDGIEENHPHGRFHMASVAPTVFFFPLGNYQYHITFVIPILKSLLRGNTRAIPAGYLFADVVGDGHSNAFTVSLAGHPPHLTTAVSHLYSTNVNNSHFANTTTLVPSLLLSLTHFERARHRELLNRQ